MAVENNFFVMKKKSLFSNYILVVDTKELLAERIAEEKEHIRVSPKYFCEKKDEKFILVLYKVKKKDKDAFLSILKLIENRVLLLGYRGYDRLCESFSKDMQAMA